MGGATINKLFQLNFMYKVNYYTGGKHLSIELGDAKNFDQAYMLAKEWATAVFRTEWIIESIARIETPIQ